MRKSYEYIKSHSNWYQNYDFKNFSSLPVLEKSDIINNLNQIKTVSEKEGLVSLTGGTTGASMKVLYTKSDIQERFAILDHFRAQHGYELGKRTAWFSGKNLITEADINKGICSHYDFINKIRFYSTFHINSSNFDVYWKSLNRFSPEFIVGFPSSVYEICQIADSLGLRLKNEVKVFFPTAETVLPEHREVIGRVLGCKLVNQYASSEGAPFILECKAGNLHIHPLTGIFEVVDQDMNSSKNGEILVTSFTTYGTPLVRYRIGDRIALAKSSKTCKCGSIFPLVEQIEGRNNDFLYSPSKGRVNSNLLTVFTKNIEGLVCLQVIQNSEEEVHLKVLSDNRKYNNHSEKKLIESIKSLMGESISLKIEYIDYIPREKSGKFRLVKNNLSL